MYLWHIISRERSELIRKIYETQKISSNTGDWIRLVENDLKDLKIDIEENEIRCISKEKFKNFIKSKVKIKFLTQL